MLKIFIYHNKNVKECEVIWMFTGFVIGVIIGGLVGMSAKTYVNKND